MASRKPRSSNDQDGPQLALVPNGAKEGQLMLLFETYGERYTARRLAAYAEDLAAVELAIVAEAIRTWRRAQPAHTQAPSPAELVALCRQLATPRSSAVVLEEVPPPKQDLDALLTELAAENPDNPHYHRILRERALAKAHGRPMDAVQTALRLGVAGHAMPGAGADIRALPAPEPC
jgi:hypothetical protein